MSAFDPKRTSGKPSRNNEISFCKPACHCFRYHLALRYDGKASDMKIDGRCHCGHITYEADIDLAKVMICHCTDCQTLSGSAFRTVAFSEEGTFRLLTGELKIYVKTSESGNKRPQSFCPECGTPIYSTTLGNDPKVYIIRVGTIRQRDQLVPKGQLWFRSSQRWLAHLDDIAKLETQPAFNRSGGVI
jgi:hypothetical protein